MRIELGKNGKERKYVLHKLRKKTPRRRLAVRLPAAARTARAADVHTAGAAAAKLSYVLRELVKEVYVDAPDKSSGKRRQKVYIEYDLVGYIPVDELLKAEQA